MIKDDIIVAIRKLRKNGRGFELSVPPAFVRLNTLKAGDLLVIKMDYKNRLIVETEKYS